MAVLTQADFIRKSGDKLFNGLLTYCSFVLLCKPKFLPDLRAGRKNINVDTAYPIHIIIINPENYIILDLY